MKVIIRKHTAPVLMAALGAPDVRYFDVYINGELSGTLNTRSDTDRSALRSKLLRGGFGVIDLTDDDDQSTLTQAV